MKKIWILLLALAMLLAGCGGKADTASSRAVSSSAPTRRSDTPAKATTLTVTFSNSSDYMFNEIYISPTADDNWGEELLGSTRILKSNGSIEVDIPAYDFENYDILVVDEDRDEYHFTRVPLQNGSEVAIYFGGEGLAADVYDAAGNATATVPGTLGSGGDEPDPDPDEMAWIEFRFANGTSHIIFDALYLMPEGTTDEAEMGYNHIASVAPLESGEAADIGVDDYVYFDILLMDNYGGGWYYQGVYLEADCLAYPTNHNGSGFVVEYADGSKAEYLGDLYT